MEDKTTPIVLTREAIIKGLVAYTYQFDGYSDYAHGWAEDGYNLFIRGARGEFDQRFLEEDEDEKDGKSDD